MKYKILLAILCIISLQIKAQTITFDTKDYCSLGVYDTWEESPFRTGHLDGNCQVINDFTANITTSQRINNKILALQRSRYGSNTFGALINLNQTFELTPNYIYAHIRMLKPVAGRVMLIGLGKRSERTRQSPQTEQFWVMSSNPVMPNTWTDAVFPIKGAGGIDIYSLVIIPHCESPHQLTEDFACYFDDIEINNDPRPRFATNTAIDKHPEGANQLSLTEQYRKANGDYCRVNDANRNGEVLAADGSRLTGYRAPIGKPFTIRMNPERGFTYAGIRVRHGFNLAGEPIIAGIRQYQDVTFSKELFTDDMFTIPAQCMDGDVEIEGLFVEKNRQTEEF